MIKLQYKKKHACVTGGCIILLECKKWFINRPDISISGKDITSQVLFIKGADEYGLYNVNSVIFKIRTN